MLIEREPAEPLSRWWRDRGRVKVETFGMWAARFVCVVAMMMIFHELIEKTPDYSYITFWLLLFYMNIHGAVRDRRS